MKKPTLYLTGPSRGLPTLADVVALFRALTGREPSPDDVAAAKRRLETQLGIKDAGLRSKGGGQ